MNLQEASRRIERLEDEIEQLRKMIKRLDDLEAFRERQRIRAETRAREIPLA